jgi:hypothetical protein
MLSTIHALSGAALLALVLNAAPEPEPAPAAGTPLEAKAAFAELKTLAGRWQGSVTKPDGPAATVTYDVSGNGTAVLERLFPGTNHEMMSVYYMDGPDLVLTHYCAMGNQPRMKLVKATSNPTTLTFDFTGGTNLDPAQDTHVHGGEVRILGADTMEADWAMFSQGKPAGTNKLFLTRK